MSLGHTPLTDKRADTGGMMAQEGRPLLLRVWMLLTWVLAPLIAGVSRIMHRRMGADPARFRERLGHSSSQTDQPVIWFHAASLGEVMQIATLARNLGETQKSEVLITTTTAAGADWVAREMPEVLHRYAPLDTPAAVRGFLNGWRISAALFVEADLWPRLLGGLEQRRVPRILLNARHSRTRDRFPNAFAALLRPFALVTCRSQQVADSVKALGVTADRVHVLPDLRLTLPKLPTPAARLAPLSKAIGTRPVWLAASTHPADEDTVLAAHLKVLTAFPEALLIVAPRHVRRGTSLRKLAHSLAITAAQRSTGEDITAQTQVYIADTLGELGVFFSLSPVTFMGGSLGQEGGHNPYEPANFETALLHGPRVKNFADAYAALNTAGAAIELSAPDTLGATVVRLLQGDQAQSVAQAGQAFMKQTQDCTDRTTDLIMTAMTKTRE